ncbi:MAG: serine hydrolase, partial [Betaproteobacteria bacterium]
MHSFDSLDSLCHSFFPPDSPGAAVGILKGALRYAKGFGLANLAERIPFTPQTPFRACSVSKQFVCLLVLQLEREGKINLDAHPSTYVAALHAFPASLTVRHLCQNRSGLLDYWCVAMLTGAKAESVFTLADGAALIQSLHAPMYEAGSQYCYSNGNWRILEWIIESVTERKLPDLLAERMFALTGMKDSGWGVDTSQVLPGNARGYRRRSNAQDGNIWEEEVTRACWSGDAALITTLDDFLNWERAMLAGTLPCSERLREAMPHPDRSRGSYAYGINAWEKDGRWMLWHSGALRGWRMVHMRFPQERASVVVMMNRTENPMPCALKILQCAELKTTWDEVSESPCTGGENETFDRVLAGNYFSEKLGLLAEMSSTSGKITMDLGAEAAPMLRTGERTMANASGFYHVEHRHNVLAIHARQFGWRDLFLRIATGEGRRLLAGRQFHNALLSATMIFSADGTALTINGPHGESDRHAVRSLGDGFAAFDCTRALDETPPGRFTIRVRDDGARIDVGCFMARDLIFNR